MNALYPNPRNKLNIQIINKKELVLIKLNTGPTVHEQVQIDKFYKFLFFRFRKVNKCMICSLSSFYNWRKVHCNRRELAYGISQINGRTIGSNSTGRSTKIIVALIITHAPLQMMKTDLVKLNLVAPKLIWLN
jgi:hypothetical protein